jgi:hypothetical protein
MEIDTSADKTATVLSQSPAFSSIAGYDDVKNIINRVLSSEENFNLLLAGPPASSKTPEIYEDL